MMILGSLLSTYLFDSSSLVNDSYVEDLKIGLDNYDLADSSELNMYIGDRVIIDVTELSDDFGFDSPEKYYIETVIQPLILEKYQNEFIYKDMSKVQELQTQLGKEIGKLDNFDWRAFILEKKTALENEIKELENSKTNNVGSNDSINKELEQLKINLWALDYRLEKEIPYSYDYASMLVDDYLFYSEEYTNLVKDESLIKDRNELIRYRENISNYFTISYKIENNILNNSGDAEEAFNIEYVIASFSFVDELIVIAIIIIVGAIIAEEFNKGTIKQLLTKPFSRSKILTSKILAGLIAISLFIVVYEIVFLGVNCIELGGISWIFENSIIYDFSINKVRELNVLGQCLYGFITVLPAYFIIYFIVLLVGVIATNSIASAIAGFASLFGAPLLDMFLNSKIMSFVPFFTWDLSPFMYGGLSSNQYATLGKCLIVDFITLIVLIISSYVIFNKKDIKNQ
jgi:ABC-2 type transport system permease protein